MRIALIIDDLQAFKAFGTPFALMSANKSIYFLEIQMKLLIANALLVVSLFGMGGTFSTFANSETTIIQQQDQTSKLPPNVIKAIQDKLRELNANPSLRSVTLVCHVRIDCHVITYRADPNGPGWVVSSIRFIC